jgi:hypothetical protein
MQTCPTWESTFLPHGAEKRKNPRVFLKTTLKSITLGIAGSSGKSSQ